MPQPPSKSAHRPSYELALAAYRSADNEACLQHLADLDHPKPTILRVRALTRLGRLRDARDVVLEASLEDAGELERAELNVAYANIAIKLEQPDVLEAFDDALFAIEAAGSRNLGAELAFLRARHAWTNGDLETAEAYARASAAFDVDDRSSVPQRAHLRAFSLDLQGLIAQDREQFELAVRYSRQALDAYAEALEPDAWVAAYCTANLAILARDFPCATSTATLESYIARVSWTPEIAGQGFFALHGLGWSHAHEHDYESALRAFHAAANIAPSPALKCMAWIDHAALSRTAGVGASAGAAILNAAASAETIRWEDVHDQERLVLLFAAESVALVDPIRARHLLTRYERTRDAEDRVTPGMPGSGNVRWHCFELRAEATGLRAEGLAERAVALFREECETWKRIGSQTRATIAQRDSRDATLR